MSEFNSSDEFFDWYIPEIQKHAPNLEELVLGKQQKKIPKLLPDLSEDEITSMFLKIREFVNIPDDVHLVYRKKSITYASRYNTQLKRLEILCPKYTIYHLRYKPVIRAAMQHEMGHILNRDYKFNPAGGHGACSNRCMDIRINEHIDREDLRDLFNAVYYFRFTEFPMLVPEETFPEMNLPMKKKGTYSFGVIHTYYHLSKLDEPEPPEKPPKIYELPQLGDIVKINKTSSYGKVIAISEEKVEVEKMTKKEVDEHFKKLKGGTGMGSYTPTK